MKRFLLTLALLLAAAGPSFAQMKVRHVQPIVYYQGGMSVYANSGFFSLENGESRLVGRGGFKAGVGAELDYGNNFYLIPMLQLSKTRVRDERGNFSFLWLQVPVLADYRIDLADYLSLDLGGGPYVARNLAGGRSRDYSRFDAGLTGRFSCVILKHFIVGVHCNFGLVDLEQNSGGTSRLNSLALSMGFRL